MGCIESTMTNEQAHRCDSAQNALSLGSQFNEILSLSSHCSASPRPIEEQISRAFLETRRRYLTIELPIEPEMTIRIVSLNIQQGGGKRTGPIADWLTTKTTSAVVLPEWRNNTSGQCIRKRLTGSGFQTVRAMAFGSIMFSGTRHSSPVFRRFGAPLTMRHEIWIERPQRSRSRSRLG
jgi:hypothetical protein